MRRCAIKVQKWWQRAVTRHAYRLVLVLRCEAMKRGLVTSYALHFLRLSNAMRMVCWHHTDNIREKITDEWSMIKPRRLQRGRKAIVSNLRSFRVFIDEERSIEQCLWKESLTGTPRIDIGERTPVNSIRFLICRIRFSICYTRARLTRQNWWSKSGFYCIIHLQRT